MRFCALAREKSVRDVNAIHAEGTVPVTFSICIKSVVNLVLLRFSALKLYMSYLYPALHKTACVKQCSAKWRETGSFPDIRIQPDRTQ